MRFYGMTEEDIARFKEELRAESGALSQISKALERAIWDARD